MSSDNEIVTKLRSKCEKMPRGSYSAMAAQMGVAPGTLRVIFATGVLPARGETTKRIVRWLAVNLDAEKASDFRMVDDGE